MCEYEFYSEGPKGEIKKLIAFRSFRGSHNVFNITFGDNGVIDEKVITNNHDSRKVLATVALAIFRFCEKYPDYYVYISGNTKTRTRLYRMSITNNLTEIQNTLEVYGFAEEWETFVKGRDYAAFLIKKGK